MLIAIINALIALFERGLPALAEISGGARAKKEVQNEELAHSIRDSALARAVTEPDRLHDDDGFKRSDT